VDFTVKGSHGETGSCPFNSGGDDLAPFGIEIIRLRRSVSIVVGYLLLENDSITGRDGAGQFCS